LKDWIVLCEIWSVHNGEDVVFWVDTSLIGGYHNFGGMYGFLLQRIRFPFKRVHCMGRAFLVFKGLIDTYLLCSSYVCIRKGKDSLCLCIMKFMFWIGLFLVLPLPPYSVSITSYSCYSQCVRGQKPAVEVYIYMCYWYLWFCLKLPL
jgi:hypothetical protein